MSSALATVLSYRIRPAEESDLGIVIESWSREAYQLHRDARLSVFRRELKRYISRLIARGDQILVAFASDEPTVVYGWLCHSADAVRFLFVKPGVRRAGIARALLQAAGFTPPITTTSRLTPIAKAIKHTHPDQLLYRPFND